MTVTRDRASVQAAHAWVRGDSGPVRGSSPDGSSASGEEEEEPGGRAAGTPPSGVPRPEPSISVVIPVRNQPRELSACIEGLFAAGVPRDAIVVADDASTDGTADVAEAMGVRVVRRPERGGPAAARNQGARVSPGDVLLFVDSDVVVDPGAVGRVLATLRERPDVAAVFGSYDDEPSRPELVSQYRNLLHHFVHQTGRTEASTFWTGCGAVRRDAFEAVGGFDERPDLNYVEDIELGLRLRRAGYRVLLDKGMRAKHLKRWDLASMVRTDLLHRAVPWSRVLLAGGALPRDLNLAWRHRLSVALTGVGCVCLALLLWSPMALPVGAAAFAGVGALSAPFFSLLHRKKGFRFAVACFPLHLIHHLCGGLGFGYAWIETKLGPLMRRRRAGGGR